MLRLLPFSFVLCLFVFSWHSSSFAETENPYAAPQTSGIEDSIPRFERHRNIRTLVSGLQWGSTMSGVMGIPASYFMFGQNAFENPIYVGMSAFMAVAPLIHANSAIEMERIRRRLVAAMQSDISPQVLEPVGAFLRVEAQKRAMPCSRVAKAATGVLTAASGGMIAGTAYTWEKEIGNAWDQARDGLAEILWNLQNR